MYHSNDYPNQALDAHIRRQRSVLFITALILAFSHSSSQALSPIPPISMVTETKLPRSTSAPPSIAGPIGEEPRFRQDLPLSLESGWLQLSVRPRERTLSGLLIMVGTRTEQGILHAQLPRGLQTLKASVQCREAATQIYDDQVAIQVGDCPPQGCVVELSWTLDAAGWESENHSSRLGPDGYSLNALDIMPRPHAGKAPHPLPASPPDQTMTETLAGDWRWIVRIDGVEGEPLVHRGTLGSPLDFADAWMPAGE